MFSSAIALAAVFSAPLAPAQNPITPPGMYIADPEGRQWADGRMYVYGSRDESVERYCSWNYHVLSSSDLIHWHVDENSFASQGPTDQVTYSDNRLYAPDCVYRNGTYYLFYCLAGGGEDEGVATSQSPWGPFRNGQRIKGLRQIDPAVLVDDDGQAYIYWGQNNSKAARLKPNLSEVEPGSLKTNVLTKKEHFFHEASSVRKRNGIYYYVYAYIGRRARPTCLAYATSKSPLGPFTYQGVIVDNYGSDPKVWNNHGCITEFNGKWYVLYHRSTHGSVTMRKACIEPITFRADGTIPEVEMTSQGAAGPLGAFDRIEAERACLLSGNVRVQGWEGNQEVLGGIGPEDTATYKYLDFGKGAGSFSAKVVDSGAGGTIEIYLDSLVGKKIGVCEIPPSPAPEAWAVHTCGVTGPVGVHALCLKFVGSATNLFQLDWFTFSPTDDSVGLQNR